MGALRVAVVGAGPAGAAAAIHLANSGCEVTLIDKATFPRDKCCGDGLTTSALRQLEALGLDARTLPSWRQVLETTWRSPSGHTIELPVPDDGVRIGVARRSELDSAIVQLVRNRTDVTFHESTPLTSASVHNGVVRLSAGSVEFECDFVIGADGMWSPLRRMVGPPTEPYLGDIHAFRQYFTGVTGIAKDRLWISFERDLLPGYVWSFPIGDGGANVGFGVNRRAGQSVAWMKDAWKDILERPHVREVLGPNAQPESPHKAWPIPARVQTTLLSALGGRALFIGDAARVVDPLTGEGIGQALETAELATAAITRAGADRPDLAAEDYRRSIARGMAIDNSFARMLSRLVTHELPMRSVIRLAPSGPWKGRYAMKWAFEDNPRAALLTPWRWQKRFAAKGGAYRSDQSVDAH